MNLRGASKGFQSTSRISLCAFWKAVRKICHSISLPTLHVHTERYMLLIQDCINFSDTFKIHISGDFKKKKKKKTIFFKVADRVVRFSYDCLSANIQIFFSYSTTSPFIQKTNKQTKPNFNRAQAWPISHQRVHWRIKDLQWSISTVALTLL